MITSSRITTARKRRGLTLAELSTRVGVSVQSLSNYERGRTEPTPDTLARLAKALRFPESFFSQPDLEPIPLEAVSFRARSKLAAGPRDAALWASRLALELHGWIEERFRLPANDIPTLGRPDPETAAEMVRARWGLGAAPISNMVHLLEVHGVRVFSLPPEYADVDAFAMWRDGTPFIFLNTLKTPERGRFDAAHELGHLVLHGEDRSLAGPHAEQEANAFASAFLMPRQSVMEHMPKTPLVQEILRGKRIWKVAALALTYRLHDVDMLSDWHYRRTCIELGKLGYRRGEPSGMPRRESSQLLEKVFATTKAKGVTLHAIARDLHVDPEELSSWVFGLIVTARGGGSLPSAEEAPPAGPRLSLVQ
ncbi:helix-turn-helix domain-containing protein [Streptomyces avermitilis]|uniref:helix-turn-helix domain-containing protein n=1 Tax=Streptomyces sp. A2-16 TaxID=2781734 RepID=UPI001BB0416A|nr:XRE family transcriptional regulator [Streptomyces sp. A2-16]QUC62996.1 XRE family transcriptional regulator [Streptomyces sp. A2-16]